MGNWARTAANLTEQLKKLETSDAAAETAFHAAYPRLKGLLGKLIEYCQAVPEEMARFVNDAELLRGVTQAMAEQEAVIRALIAALDTTHA